MPISGSPRSSPDTVSIFIHTHYTWALNGGETEVEATCIRAISYLGFLSQIYNLSGD